jgi:hypothetical protein
MVNSGLVNWRLVNSGIFIGKKSFATKAQRALRITKTFPCESLSLRVLVAEENLGIKILPLMHKGF